MLFFITLLELLIFNFFFYFFFMPDNRISFATWILMNILLCAVPRYGSYTMILTGLLLLSTNLTYALLLPKPPLLIPFEGAQLRFQLGWCFWAVCLAGFLAIFIGAIYALLDTLYPNKFSTILEVDYDTPYRYFVGNDAHLLSSHDLLAKSPSSSKTNSTTTSCCGRQMLQKLKSDASTSTVMSIPVNEKHKHRTSLTSNSHNIFQQGKDNAAYEPELDSKSIKSNLNNPNKSIKINRLDESYNENYNGENSEEIELKQANDVNNNKRTQQRSQNALNTSASSGEDSEVTTTIIDGKRAVSLHNFGKFAEQQQRQFNRSKQFVQNSFTNNSSQNRYFR